MSATAIAPQRPTALRSEHAGEAGRTATVLKILMRAISLIHAVMAALFVCGGVLLIIMARSARIAN
jgi:hypothetical protein